MSCRFLPFLMMCMVLASSARADSISTSAWRIGGMIDTYARHTIDAVFAENLFNVELAMVDVKYRTSHVRARVALHAGDYVTRNYQSDVIVDASFLRLLHAAHVGVRFGDQLWVDVGIMPSHIGNETAISSENLCYTPSLIAETSPYYETGAKVSLQITDGIMVAILALNGWQNIYDWDSETAFGSLVTVEPSDAWKFGWSTYIGPGEISPSTPLTTRYFSDLYASFTGGDFTVAAAFDIGKQELPVGSRDAQRETVQAVWYGATLQGRWNLDSAIRLNARFELFHDPENVMKRAAGRNQFEPYIPYEVFGGSIGLDVLPRQNTQLRFEGRVLHSPSEIFPKPGGTITEHKLRSTELWFTAALVVTIP